MKYIDAFVYKPHPFRDSVTDRRLLDNSPARLIALQISSARKRKTLLANDEAFKQAVEDTL